jgi:gliding motility associated protien GldN
LTLLKRNKNKLYFLKGNFIMKHRIGFIGYGNMGGGYHWEVAHDRTDVCDDLKPVAVFDFRESQRKLAEERGMKAYDKFDDFIKSCDILLTVKTDSITGDTLSAEIDESNIPNREVLKYYVKEVWYFDKHNSVFTVRLIALCPIWYREDYELGLQKRPLFWATYDDLRPYLAQQEALISDKNNGARETVDDLFIKRRFGSYIFKESSIMNRNILQYNHTAEEMHKEQNRIKTEIINFEQDLWEY